MKLCDACGTPHSMTDEDLGAVACALGGEMARPKVSAAVKELRSRAVALARREALLEVDLAVVRKERMELSQKLAAMQAAPLKKEEVADGGDAAGG